MFVKESDSILFIYAIWNFLFVSFYLIVRKTILEKDENSSDDFIDILNRIDVIVTSGNQEKLKVLTESIQNNDYSKSLLFCFILQRRLVLLSIICLLIS